MQMIWAYSLLIQRFARPWTFLSNLPYVVAILSMVIVAHATHLKTAILSPNGRNSIVLRAADTDDAQVHFTVSRHSRNILGPVATRSRADSLRALWEQSRVVDVQLGKVDESF